MKKILLMVISIFMLSSISYGDIMEFNIKRNSIISSPEFAYDIINQYIENRHINGKDIKVRMKRNISYSIYDDNKQGTVYEYLFKILYTPIGQKRLVHDVHELKLILIISKFDDKKEIEIYKFDVSNTLK